MTIKELDIRTAIANLDLDKVKLILIFPGPKEEKETTL
jgi:hypothetical protein